MLSGAATVFTARDIERSLPFYFDGLGFGVRFQFGEPTCYLRLFATRFALRLPATSGTTTRQTGQGGLCVFVKDVDAIHAEIASLGMEVLKPPRDYDYIYLIDPDGNHLTSGMASKAQLWAPTPDAAGSTPQRAPRRLWPRSH